MDFRHVKFASGIKILHLLHSWQRCTSCSCSETHPSYKIVKHRVSSISFIIRELLPVKIKYPFYCNGIPSSSVTMAGNRAKKSVRISTSCFFTSMNRILTHVERNNKDLPLCLLRMVLGLFFIAIALLNPMTDIIIRMPVLRIWFVSVFTKLKGLVFIFIRAAAAATDPLRPWTTI